MCINPYEVDLDDNGFGVFPQSLNDKSKMLVPFEDVANRLLQDEEVFQSYKERLCEMGIHLPTKNTNKK